ncbi:MAG: hypothetical protein LBH04_07625 [Tannerellaceae bacterium]|nr:hypothetical protein [Tannerellaceae bacterium]
MNKFLMFTVALGIVFLSSCTNEEKIGTAPYNGGDGYLSFILPLGKGGPVTYGTITADSMENDIQTLRIYWFGADGKLLKVFAYPQHGTSELAIFDFSEDKQSATAVGKIATGTVGGLSHFYFVANVNDPNGGGIRSSALSQVSLNTTTEGVFQKMLTDELAAQTDGNLTEIKCPLPMSLSKNDHGGLMYVELDPSLTPSVTVHMKRRVARFDIENNEDFSGFHVKNVIISNAKTAGFIQDSMDVSDNSGKMIIDVEATANGTPLDSSLGEDQDVIKGDGTAGSDKIPDGFQGANPPKDSLEINKSQFYLFPTTLTKSDGGTPGNTIISIEGTYNGETRIYTLETKSGNDIDILANKAYRIRIRRYVENNLIANFIIEPWDWDGDSIATNRDQRGVIFSHVQQAPGDTSIVSFKNAQISDGAGGFIDGNVNDGTLVDTIRYTAAPGQQYAEFLLVDTGYTLAGDNVATANVTSLALQSNYSGFLAEDSMAVLAASHACTFSTIRTYAGEGLHYETTHRIRLPHTKAPIAFNIFIQSQTNSTRSKKYYVESWDYNEMGYAPVKVGDVLWAPLNVGATVIPAAKIAWKDKDSIARSWTGTYFQWGRNVPFYPDSSASISANKKNGPLTLADAQATSSFIISSTGDWLKSTDLDNDLWGGVSNDSTKMQGPCPKYWYIPSFAQGKALEAALKNASSTYSAYWHDFHVTGRNNESCSLYFPLGGKVGTDGGVANYGTSATNSYSYYAFRNTYNNVSPYRLVVSNQALGPTSFLYNDADTKNIGWLVRAVRDYVLMPYERVPKQ